MDLERARDFLRAHHHAVLATYHRDFKVQLSPVTVGVDAAGFAVISTQETAVKTKNIRRDPRVTLCVLDDQFFGEWVYVDGSAEVLSLPDAMQPLVDYYRGIAGEHPDWEDYRAAMERDRRVLLRVTLTHAGPDFSG